MSGLTKSKKIMMLEAHLEDRRRPFRTFWDEVEEYISPGTARFELSNVNIGERRDRSIVDSTPIHASQVLGAGFVSHVTPWWDRWARIKTSDPDLAEYGPVARWSDDVSLALMDVFAEANLYEQLLPFYRYMGDYGNGAMSLQERLGRVLHARTIPLGQYWVAVDEWGDLSVFRQVLRLTVGVVVPMFGRRTASGGYDWSNFSPRIQKAWDACSYGETVDICQIIYPNEDYNPRGWNAKDKRFSSVWYEVGDLGAMRPGDSRERFLRESGMDEIQILFSPWERVGEDVYGFICPGYTAIGDDRELQHGALKEGIAIDKMLDPPLQGGAATKQIRPGYLPNQVTALSTDDIQKGGFRPLFEVDPKLLGLEKRMDRISRRIERSYHVDTFRMLDYYADREMTATEIAAREGERLAQLSGVLNRLNYHVLDPLVQRTFNWMLVQGRIPPPPPELQGQKLKVEYVSRMAQALRAQGLAPVERVLGVVASIAAYDPGIVHKVNLDQSVDEIAKGTGAPARIIFDDETAAARRQQASLLARQEAQAQQLLAATKGAEALSRADTSGKNALTDLARVAGGARRRTA